MIGLAPTAWVQWVTQQPDVVAEEILGSEFQWISGENDAVECCIVRQIMRWDMAVLQESPWYQEILKEGERIGRQEGRQEEGRSLILKQLTRRMGTLPPTVVTQIQSLTLEQLETLGEALLDFSTLADLETWLAGHL
nr:DUF4351 domain-containing protein [Leptolyngbya sp. FACHB-541]